MRFVWWLVCLLLITTSAWSQTATLTPGNFFCPRPSPTPSLGAGTPTLTPTPVVVWFAMLGQSNMVGCNNTIPPESQSGIVLFGNDYLVHNVATESYDSSTNQVDAISIDNGSNGTCVPSYGPGHAFAVAWRGAHSGVIVGLIPGARGSCSMGCPNPEGPFPCWQPAANHDDRSTLYGSLHHRILSALATVPGSTLGGYIIVGGEADGVSSIMANAFAVNFSVILNAILGDWPGTFICFNGLGTSYNTVDDQTVKDQMLSINIPHVGMGALDNYECRSAGNPSACCTGTRTGTCNVLGGHYDTAGQQASGIRLADCMNALNP